MKIGLISINMYSKYLNFACPLHTFAFQQFLTYLGIDSTVINYKPIYFNNFDMEHPYDYYRNQLEILKNSNSNNFKKIADFENKALAWKTIYHEREIRYRKFQNFIDKYYTKTDFCYNSSYLEVIDPGFDCYICVTDVIWKNEPHEGFDRGFFLGSSCMENKLKISYSASRGVNFAKTDEEKDLFFRYINDIDCISVRERSLKKYIEENSNKKSTLVLDPVLLHDSSFWDNYVQKPKEENYLFLYYVVEKATDTIEQAVKYAKSHNLKIIEVTDRPLKDGRILDTDVEHIYLYSIGLEEWLGYIKYANCIFTNSFHGTCFSIIFQKNFFVGKRNGDKVINLLEIFNLSERCFAENTDILYKDIPINYSNIKPILDKMKQTSIDFITDSLQITSKHNYNQYKIWKQNQSYVMIYKSICDNNIHYNFDKSKGKILENINNYIEYILSNKLQNTGCNKFIQNFYNSENYIFKGWKLQILIDKNWFYYSEDETLIDVNINSNIPAYIFKENSVIPFLNYNGISKVFAEAVWEKL